MYLPSYFKEDRVEVMHRLMHEHPLGALVTLGPDGLNANHIPLQVHPEPAPFGTLRKPLRNLYFGGDYGYRYRRGDLKPSNNYGGYLTYPQIPGIESSATVSFNRLSSSYTEGDMGCNSEQTNCIRI